MKGNQKKTKHLYVLLTGFVIIGLLSLKTYINNKHRLAESKYNYLVETIKKEQSEYWDMKSKMDVAIDKKLDTDKKLQSKLKKVDKKDVSRVVFK